MTRCECVEFPAVQVCALVSDTNNKVLVYQDEFSGNDCGTQLVLVIQLVFHTNRRKSNLSHEPVNNAADMLLDLENLFGDTCELDTVSDFSGSSRMSLFCSHSARSNHRLTLTSHP